MGHIVDYNSGSNTINICTNFDSTVYDLPTSISWKGISSLQSQIHLWYAFFSMHLWIVLLAPCSRGKTYHDGRPRKHKSNSCNTIQRLWKRRRISSCMGLRTVPHSIFKPSGVMWKFLGNGIFNVDGHIWSDSRALLRPQFHRQRVSDLHVFEDHISKMIQLLPKNGETIELMAWWFRFTLDASTEYLFGESVESLVNPKVNPGILITSDWY